jgi:hypothetical protein
LSETEQEREDRESGKNDLAVEAGFCGLEAGCCLLKALTVLALFLSVSTLLLVNR